MKNKNERHHWFFWNPWLVGEIAKCTKGNIYNTLLTQNLLKKRFTNFLHRILTWMIWQVLCDPQKKNLIFKLDEACTRGIMLAMLSEVVSYK